MFEALGIKKFMQLLCNTCKSIMYIDCHFDDSVGDTYWDSCPNMFDLFYMNESAAQKSEILFRYKKF